MSRQFRVFLLPTDAETLIQKLRSRLEVTILQPSSPGPFAVRAESPVLNSSLGVRGEMTRRVDCYLAPATNADIRLNFYPTLSRWSIQQESEVIEFGGCEYDERVLVVGRFYFQTDLLVEGMVVPKRPEFLTWAEKVFRTDKKSLLRSKTLDAYIGEEAEKWRQRGGKFAWMVNQVRGQST